MPRSALPATFALAVLLAAGSARAAETFEISLKAFTPTGAPIGERTATCSAAKPCRFSWPIETDGQFKAVTVVVKEFRPGELQVLADNGPFRVGALRLQNKPGATGELAAVTKSAGRPNVLMNFHVIRH